MKLRTFTLALAAEFLSYGLIVLDARSITSASFAVNAIINVVFITQNFFVLKWMNEVKEARGPWALAGFLVGGVSGAELALWLSIHYIGGAR